MIEIEGLVKHFGLTSVLRGLNLRVAPGELLALLGPNGTGKTTLLRILASLTHPSAGLVRVGGWPLPKAAARVRPHLGFASHQPLLYGKLTAEENLRFYGRMYGLDRPESRIDEVLTDVGLSRRRSERVDQYSRGMQQRLAIARAILHRPDVLLLDEPYSGLDQDGTARLDQILRGLVTDGRTVVMTTHDVTRGLATAHRAAVLSRGQVICDVQCAQVDPDAFAQEYRQATSRGASQ